MPQFHPLIATLDLRQNDLDDMAALALADVVAATGYPAVIDLRKCGDITDVGGRALLLGSSASKATASARSSWRKCRHL